MPHLQERHLAGKHDIKSALVVRESCTKRNHFCVDISNISLEGGADQPDYFRVLYPLRQHGYFLSEYGHNAWDTKSDSRGPSLQAHRTARTVGKVSIIKTGGQTSVLPDNLSQPSSFS